MQAAKRNPARRTSECNRTVAIARSIGARQSFSASSSPNEYHCDTFPTRPLRVAKSGIGSPTGLAIMALVMFALLIGGAIWVGPNLVRDVVIQADPVEVPGGRYHQCRMLDLSRPHHQLRRRYCL